MFVSRVFLAFPHLSVFHYSVIFENVLFSLVLLHGSESNACFTLFYSLTSCSASLAVFSSEFLECSGKSLFHGAITQSSVFTSIISITSVFSDK